MQKSMLSVAGVLVLGVMLVLVNSIGNNLFGRFYLDLTAEHLYTLSDGSKHILAGMKEPMTIKFYLSKTDGAQYPAVKMYGDRVLSLLKEFERNSKGLITLEAYDPRPDSDEEGWAQKYGITPLGMPNGEQLYFGLVAVSSDGREEAIPVFNLARQEFLEFDVTKLIYSLSLDKKPTVGIISSLDMKGESPSPMMGRRGEGQEPWVLVGQISNIAEASFLANDVKEIPKEIKELLVVHPKNLSEVTRYAIDQFVMRGGNLVVAVDPYCNADQPAPDPSNPTSAMFADKGSNFKELLSPWGVELAQGKVVGDVNLATKVNTGDGGPPKDFVFWMSVTGATESPEPLINRENILTSQLDNLLFAWAGVLKVTPVEGITTETLFRTTNDAALFDEGDYRFGGGSPDALLNKYVKGTAPQTLGVKLSGRFKSTFKAKPEGAEGGEYLAEAKEGAHVVVLSDVDFLTDQTSAAVQRFLGTKLVSLLNDNLVFAANLVENLLGSNDLISLRSRGQFTRPFTKVQEIEQKAQERWRLEETALQAKLKSATDRLNQLQSASGVGDSKRGEAQVLTKEMLDEVKRFRDERADAQSRLREVRRNLRQDKERLGSWLFVLNTFFIPLLLIVGYVLWQRRPVAR